MFYTKKQKQKNGGLHPHQSISLDPLRGLQLPPDPQLQSFLALPKTDAPIFFLYCPLNWFATDFQLQLADLNLQFATDGRTSRTLLLLLHTD